MPISCGDYSTQCGISHVQDVLNALRVTGQNLRVINCYYDLTPAATRERTYIAYADGVYVKSRLHDTTGCQFGCTTGLTTGCIV